MITPNDLLANGKALTALLSELAPEATKEERDHVKRLEIIDQIIGALLPGKDPELRLLLLDTAALHVGLSKPICRSRMTRALADLAAIQTDMQRQTDERLAAEAAAKEAAEIKASAPPPLDQYKAAIDAPADALTYLLAMVAPKPAELADHDKLRVLDDLLIVLTAIEDVTLRDLSLDQAAAWLDLKPRMVKARVRSAQSAPTNPAGPDVGGEIKDGGFHSALVGTLKRYLMRRDLYPDAVNGWLDVAGKSVGIKTRELVNDFHFQHASFFESLPRDRIDITLAGLTQEGRARRRATILAAITGKPSTADGLAALRRWLRATTGREDPVDLAVMLHWMWQVKRLNTNNLVAWDLMPILVGFQGDGKSTAIERLCSPWSELVININAATLTDDRSTEILGDYAIGFWGEMSGGNKAEVQALKNTMTAKRKGYRELGGHHFNSVIRRMAFIGDSNNPVRDVIADATGMRRFYEMKVDGVTDREVLNGLDYLLVWQAVSEDDAAPFDAVADQVKERQRDLIVQDTFDNFLAWCDERQWEKLTALIDGQPYVNGEPPTITVFRYNPERGYTLSEVCILFRQFIRTVGGTQRNSDWVAKRLGEARWVTKRPRKAKVPEEATAQSISRQRFYFKPEPVGDDGLTDQERTAKEAAARAAKITSDPSPAEDLFAGAAGIRLREPGADEDEPPYRPEDADGPVPE